MFLLHQRPTPITHHPSVVATLWSGTALNTITFGELKQHYWPLPTPSPPPCWSSLKTLNSAIHHITHLPSDEAHAQRKSGTSCPRTVTHLPSPLAYSHLRSTICPILHFREFKIRHAPIRLGNVPPWEGLLNFSEISIPLFEIKYPPTRMPNAISRLYMHRTHQLVSLDPEQILANIGKYWQISDPEQILAEYTHTTSQPSWPDYVTEDDNDDGRKTRRGGSRE